jgi:glutamate 5-kinase
MFTDNDELSGLIATMMNVQALFLLSNVDGIYNGPPEAEGSEIIRHVAAGRSLDEYIQASKSAFGRGGMQTKCAIARKVADEGIAVWIANGKREGILTSLVFNPEAACFTCFEPAQ